uniref:Uncharacterized protein n=1 Tax=Anguilla anguilla TaxID=7936 RepID=A0A0E9VRL9_ANGAN
MILQILQILLTSQVFSTSYLLNIKHKKPY